MAFTKEEAEKYEEAERLEDSMSEVRIPMEKALFYASALRLHMGEIGMQPTRDHPLRQLLKALSGPVDQVMDEILKNRRKD